MATLDTILKKEIDRISKRNVRRELKALMETIRKQRAAISLLKKQFAELKKQSALTNTIKKREVVLSDNAVKKARFSPILIKKLRKKLKITQNSLAKLLGVSLGAVATWESGKTKPNTKSRKGIVMLRTLSAAAVKKLVEQKKTVV